MSPAVRTRPYALLSLALCAVMVLVAAQLATNGPVTSQPSVHGQRVALQTRQTSLSLAAVAVAGTIKRPATTATTTSTTSTTTTTTTAPAPAPAPTTTTTTAPPAPAPVVVASDPAPTNPAAVPPVGQATTWGCSAALAYLQAYAAKGFALQCPGYAEGQEAMTCMNTAGACPGTSVIAIADPCPQAYMNEASNSYVIIGATDTPIDPFGPCP